MKKCLTFWSAVALLVASAACTKSSNPATPSTPSTTEAAASVTDAKLGITITTPQLISPAVNATPRFADQPLTLTIKNAASSGSSAITYTFQVASDASFTTIVVSKDVAE